MKKVRLADMTRVEFAEEQKNDPVILIPLGSIEQHGPACPMGDFILADKLAERIARETGALCAPTLPFGHADYFHAVPGGVALRAETFRSVLRDICENFLEHGLTRLVIINGHGGNKPLILETLRDLRREWDVILPSISLWGNIPLDVWGEACPDLGKAQFGHGAEPVASLYMRHAPELMRLDLAQDFDGKKAYRCFPAIGVGGASYRDLAIQLPMNIDDVNDDGLTGGSLAGACAERGEVFEAALTARIAAFIADFYQL
ncbi:MAG: creatininase family protein [Cohaesibacter sp.]|nr:creatininase family protein [Cohaesibacter sp.]